MSILHNEELGNYVSGFWSVIFAFFLQDIIQNISKHPNLLFAGVTLLYTIAYFLYFIMIIVYKKDLNSLLSRLNKLDIKILIKIILIILPLLRNNRVKISFAFIVLFVAPLCFHFSKIVNPLLVSLNMLGNCSLFIWQYSKICYFFESERITNIIIILFIAFALILPAFSFI